MRLSVLSARSVDETAVGNELTRVPETIKGVVIVEEFPSVGLTVWLGWGVELSVGIGDRVLVGKAAMVSAIPVEAST